MDMRRFLRNRCVPLVRGLYWNFTFLRPLLAGIYDTIFPSAMRFSGLGLTTRHELPWNDDYDWGAFRKASVDIKKCFEEHFDNNLTSLETDLDAFSKEHAI